MKNRYLDGMMGLVVGDACGVPVEFKRRLELKKNPVTDMREYGTHDQPRGTWSDDSSMALATLASLHDGYNLDDIAKQFLRWDQEEIYTPFGEVFDMGMTCSQAIQNYMDSGDPRNCGMSGERDNGNGSLMRILPVCIYAYEALKVGLISEQEAVCMIHETSSITHAHKRSLVACGLYYFCVKAIIEERENRTIGECLQKGMDEGFSFYQKTSGYEKELGVYKRLQNLKSFSECSEHSIRSSGYVVDSFEAAIYCLIHGEFYKESILLAVNLGDDTDTVAAITGGLSGLFYGVEGIPEEWKDYIVQRKWIEELCDMDSNRNTLQETAVVDIHSHLLPGTDDGSIDLKMTMKMLHMAKEQGITDLFLTSHSYYVEENPDVVRMAFEELQEATKKENIDIHMYLGCEVFAEDDFELVLEKLHKGDIPAMNNTKYVLIEFTMDVLPENAIYAVKALFDAGYRPIIAHFERYANLLEGNIAEALVKVGCLIQVNAYSLTEEEYPAFRYGARMLLGKHLVHFLGTDAHRSNHRPPRMREGVQYVWESCDKEYALDVIYRNAKKYLISSRTS